MVDVHGTSNLSREQLIDALADRFRVISLDNSVDIVERALNDCGDEGFTIQYVTKKFIIMTRIFRIPEEGEVMAGDDFTFQVPGEVGHG